MKGALSAKPEYEFDEHGNLVAEEGESEEQRFLRESIVLFREGQSLNHPYDVAVSNDPESAPPPETLDVHGRRAPANETEEEMRKREQDSQRERTEADKKSQEQSLKATAENPDRDNPPVSERSQANDSNDPDYERPTSEEEVEESDMEDVEEDKPHKSGFPTRKPGRRGR